jgi:hypothetical protein
MTELSQGCASAPEKSLFFTASAFAVSQRSACTICSGKVLAGKIRAMSGSG